MLSTKEIADRIQNPELIQKEDIVFLKELSEKHPYTQIYSILYLKGLGDFADIHFEEELQKHSYRIGDRTELFKLINDFSTPLISTSTLTEEEKIIDENIETLTHSPILELLNGESRIKEETANETSEKIQDENSINEEVETEEESIIKKEEINELSSVGSNIQNLQSEKDDRIEENSLKTLKDPLDESILHHSFASNYQLEELSEEEIEALDKRNENDELNVEQHEEDSLLEIEINTTQSFTSWLNSNKNKIENSENEKLEIEAIVNNSGLTFEVNEFFGEVVKPKKEFFSPTKKAKESLSEDALPVSETLAKVYALQGNFPKAIYAYEQLSLKYPEKKIFFAIQIKELQKKLNT